MSDISQGFTINSVTAALNAVSRLVVSLVAETIPELSGRSRIALDRLINIHNRHHQIREDQRWLRMNGNLEGLPTIRH